MSDLISILTLTYQRHEFLEEAMASYLALENAGNTEMVIINDSPVLTYSYVHPRIKIFNLPQRMTSIASKLLHGFKLCRGNYIFRLDDDDLLVPWSISSMRSAIENNPGYDIYRHNTQYTFTNNEFVGMYGNVNNGNCFSKDYCTRVQLTDTSFGEDYEIVFAKNAQIHTIDQGPPLMIYRWGGWTYHASGLGGTYTGGDFLNKIDELLKNNSAGCTASSFRTGHIELHPRLLHDYVSRIPEQYR